MTVYVCNAFSLSMLDRDQQASLGGMTPSWRLTYPRTPRPATWDEARALLDGAWRGGVPIVSAVGHADTAKIFADLLDYPIEPNRVSWMLTPPDIALVGQYVGLRLPEGAKIEWWIV